MLKILGIDMKIKYFVIKLYKKAKYIITSYFIDYDN